MMVNSGTIATLSLPIQRLAWWHKFPSAKADASERSKADLLQRQPQVITLSMNTRLPVLPSLLPLSVPQVSQAVFVFP